MPLENVVPHKEYFVESYVVEEAVSSAVGHFNDDKITVVHMFGACLLDDSQFRLAKLKT